MVFVQRALVSCHTDSPLTSARLVTDGITDASLPTQRTAHTDSEVLQDVDLNHMGKPIRWEIHTPPEQLFDRVRRPAIPAPRMQRSTDFDWTSISCENTGMWVKLCLTAHYRSIGITSTVIHFRNAACAGTPLLDVGEHGSGAGPVSSDVISHRGVVSRAVDLSADIPVDSSGQRCTHEYSFCFSCFVTSPFP